MSRCLKSIYYNCFGKVIYYTVAIFHIGVACITIYCCRCFQHSESEVPNDDNKTVVLLPESGDELGSSLHMINGDSDSSTSIEVSGATSSSVDDSVPYDLSLV